MFLGSLTAGTARIFAPAVAACYAGKHTQQKMAECRADVDRVTALVRDAHAQLEQLAQAYQLQTRSLRELLAAAASRNSTYAQLINIRISHNNRLAELIN